MRVSYDEFLTKISEGSNRSEVEALLTRDGSFRLPLDSQETHISVTVSGKLAFAYNFKTSLYLSCFRDEGLTAKEVKACENALEALQQRELEAVEAEYLRDAPRLKSIWDASQTTGESEYLINKKVKGLHGARLRFNEETKKIETIVPLYNEANFFWGYQSITPSFKCIHGKKSGNYFVLPSPEPQLDTSDIYIAEGFATASTIAELLDVAGLTGRVVFAVDAGNLPKVAHKLRSLYKEAKLIICADNDQSGVGEKQARLASRVGGENLVTKPSFSPDLIKRYQEQFGSDKYPTDWNDLSFLVGRSEAASIFQASLVKATETTLDSFISSLPMLPPEKFKKGKAPEIEVVHELEKLFHDIIRVDSKNSERTIELWNGKYWHLVSDPRRFVNASVQKVIGSVPEVKLYEAVERSLFIRLPKIPPQNVDKENIVSTFPNGTLYIKRDRESGQWSMDFKENVFSKSDSQHSMAKYPFPIEGSAREPSFFISWLRDKVFKGDKNVDKKVNFIRALVSAVACPRALPFMTYFHGEGRTGKTTLLKIIRSFVDERFIVSLPLHRFDGFDLASTVNKPFNFFSEMDSRKAIPHAITNCIIDQMPILTANKYEKGRLSLLPAYNLGCINGLPNFDDIESSNSHERRNFFVKFNNKIDASEDIKDFDLMILKEAKEIFAWGISGLKNILDNGLHMPQPEDDFGTIRDLINEGNTLEGFWKELGSGGIKGIVASGDSFIRRSKIHKLFVDFSKEHGEKIIPKTRFMLWLKEKGVTAVHDGYDVVRGFKEEYTSEF